MARKLRIEYAGAMYHVINRGNYRSWIFETEGARYSFRKCLGEACERMGWKLHAWVLMGNHYHLCLETPEPNLVTGMKWLQSTFANRFNRFRSECGHVFQGRYNAILLDGSAVGAVCHYIHLNPVRAGLIEASMLENYLDSSFAHLWRPRRRKAFEVMNTALISAGRLADTPAGRERYRDYLEWLCTEAGECDKLGFGKMSRGWAKGSRDFQRAVLGDLAGTAQRAIVESEAGEARQLRWEKAMLRGMRVLGRGDETLADSPKGVNWKVALARHLREQYLAPHGWIAENLRMGKPSYVQSLVSRHRSGRRCDYWRRLKKHEKLD